MGPKKDVKKATAKEVDASQYIRKPIDCDQAAVDRAVLENVSGKIANVETIFNIWDDTINNENWNEPILNDQIKSDIKYPKYLCVSNEIKLNKWLNLEPMEVVADPKAKKDPKKDIKKGVAETPSEIIEKFMDEHGRALPVMFRTESKESDENDTIEQQFKKCELFRNFQGLYSEEQLKLKNECDEIYTKIKNYRNDNTTDNKEIINDLQQQLKILIGTRNIHNEKPAGGEIDPILCQSYRILTRFATNITWNHPNFPANNHSQVEFNKQFLWRAIYPQLPVSGKPVYNPSGKYCVRLFLAGQWRKVYVDGDTVPVREDGTPAIAASEDKYELWPFILAKAIYTVYSACGYSKVLEDPLELYDSDHATPIGKRVIQFSSFVIHLLTSWCPSVPLSMSNIFLHEYSKSKLLLKTLISDGVCEINENDIVRDHNEENSLLRYRSFKTTRNSLLPATSRYAQDSDSDDDDFEDETEKDEQVYEVINNLHNLDQIDEAGSIDENDEYSGSFSPSKHQDNEENFLALSPFKNDGVVRCTKQQFKKEYLKRKRHREKVISDLMIREKLIVKINTAMEQVLESVCMIAFLDNENGAIRLLPVLGLSYPLFKSDNLLMVQLLVQWSTGTPVETSFDPNPTPSDSFSQGIKGEDEGPLPLTTPLVYEWISIDRLVVMNAYMITVDTNLYSDKISSYSSHWVPLSSLNNDETTDKPTFPDKNAKEKQAKGGKGGKDVVEIIAPSVDEYYTTAGTIPVTVVQMDTEQFFLPAGHATFYKRRTSLSTTKSVDQDLPVFHANTSKVPLHEFLHFTVTLHIDTVLEYKENSNSEETETKNNNPAQYLNRAFPGNTLLILQEFRSDAVVPICFIMELKSTDTYLPVVSKTFAISAKNLLSRDPSKPITFWMRLFSDASVYINFRSEVNINVGPAEKIWRDLGKAVFVKEGVTSDTFENTQQIIFRLPLVMKDKPDESQENDDIAATVNASKHIAVAFLHVNNSKIESLISTGLVKNISKCDVIHPFPRNQGNVVELKSDPNDAAVLIGRIFPSRELKKGVPSFSWKLVVLSEYELKEPEKLLLQEESTLKKYKGKFVANNQNILFRDIYKIEKSSFPIAFRLTTASKRSKTHKIHESKPLSEDDRKLKALSKSKLLGSAFKSALKVARTTDTSLVIRAYRISDNKLVAEYKGGETVLCYFQTLEKFLPDGEVYDFTSAAAATDVNGKKDSKAGKKDPKAGASVGSSDSIDIILECSLDTDIMQVPISWTSCFPHVFDCMFPDDASSTTELNEIEIKNNLIIEAQNKYLSLTVPSETLMSWQIDVMTGKVVNVTHDIRKLQAQAVIKNTWEDDSPGRSERSAAALIYYKEYISQKKESQDKDQSNENNVQSNNSNITLTATMLDNLIIALQGESEVMKQRYTLQLSLSKIIHVDAEIIHETDLLMSLIRPKGGGKSSILCNNKEEEEQLHVEYLKNRELEKIICDKRYKENANMFIELNNLLKSETKERVDFISKEAVNDAIELAKLWEAREKYRLWVGNQNFSLNNLLKRSITAKQIAKAIEKKAADEAAAIAEKLRKEEEKKAAKKK